MAGDTQYTQGIHSITVNAGDSIGFEVSSNSGSPTPFERTNEYGTVLTGLSTNWRGSLYYNVTENKSITFEFLSE
jgi:hypothetical protein